jgi:uncharacterized protein (DUF169 family)
MDLALKDRFMVLWKKYFDGAELPITFYYTNRKGPGKLVQAPLKEHQCVIGVLSKVRKGQTIYFGENSFGCGGGKRYLGYARGLRPNFEYFLSCGIEGEMEGERYKKSPEIVKKLMKESPSYEAPGKYIVFKRWDKLDEKDEPDVVIFFANPDILAGLFTLTGFEEAERDSVIAPFAAGCGSIVLYPYLEKDRKQPRGVIGMFDVSARPYVPKNNLSFSVPMNKFQRMVNDMEESFLTTQSWAKVNKRIKSTKRR